MFIPRKSNENIDKLLYWKEHPFNFSGTSLLGQCTWYVLGRVGEILGYPMTNWESMPNCSPNPCWSTYGASHAKLWLKNCLWKVSQKAKVASIGVLDGNMGHVFVVEEEYGNGMFGISQYNKNSDKKFHYEKVDLSKGSVYGMKILGFIEIPVEDTKRDESKWQIQVKVDGLRMREDHSTNADVVGFCINGEIYNVLDVYLGDFRWLKLDNGCWVATKQEWVDEFIPKTSDDELKEAKKTIQTLKEMNNTLDKELKKTKDKLIRMGAILDE